MPTKTKTLTKNLRGCRAQKYNALAKQIIPPARMQGEEDGDRRPLLAKLSQKTSTTTAPPGSLYYPSTDEVVFPAPEPFESHSFPKGLVLFSWSYYHQWNETVGQPPVFMFKPLSYVEANCEDGKFTPNVERHINVVMLFEGLAEPVALDFKSTGCATARAINEVESRRRAKNLNPAWIQLAVILKTNQEQQSWFAFSRPQVSEAPESELLRAKSAGEAVHAAFEDMIVSDTPGASPPLDREDRNAKQGQDANDTASVDPEIPY